MLLYSFMQLNTFLISQSTLFLPSNPVARLERQMSMKLVSYWEIFENKIGETLRNLWNWWDIEKSWPPPPPQSPSYELIRGSLYKVCISCQITLPLWHASLQFGVVCCGIVSCIKVWHESSCAVQFRITHPIPPLNCRVVVGWDVLGIARRIENCWKLRAEFLI